MRRSLDWVVRPEAYGTSIEFLSGSELPVFFPLTVWSASFPAAGGVPAQFTGLFESGEALTVERVRLTIFVIIQRLGTPGRFYQHAFRLRVGEGDLADPVDVEPPTEPLNYDLDDPAWANEDLLWEHRYVMSTEDLDTVNGENRFWQPQIYKIEADVKSRRRLEPPDQLQLVVQRSADGDIVPAEPLQSNVVIYARTLLSNGGVR